MTGQNKLSKFWRELKKRKVVSVIIIYASTAFILLQLINILIEPLKLPPWTMTLLIVLLSVGFPIAIIFSWVFDVSSKEIQITESIEPDSLPDKKYLSTLKFDPPEKSIIVLPFENISSDSEQEYFSDGLTEEIITDLSYIDDLLVISRSSAMTFKGSKQTIKEIAEKVNVKYVLEGSVRKSENNLRIVAQLIDAKSDTHLWAEKYNGIIDDVFKIQEKVSHSIADTLRLKLTQKEDKKLKEHPIDNIKAYELHLRAKYQMNLCSEESIKKGIELINKGLEIINENELLYAGLGRGYLFLYEFVSKEDKNYINIAEDCAKKVFNLNPSSSFGHSLRGELYLRQGKILDGAKEFKKALEINPNDSISLFRLGWLFILSGKTSFGKTLINKLVEIDPLTPLNHMAIGISEFLEERFEAGSKYIVKALDIEPNLPICQFWYSVGLAWDNKYKEAIKQFELIENNDTSVFAKLSGFFKYSLQGKKGDALKAVTEDLVSIAKEDEMYPIWMAECYSLIGEKKEAIEWLKQGVDFGFIHYPWLSEYDPFLINIRNESRFKNLMKRVKKECDNFEV